MEIISAFETGLRSRSAARFDCNDIPFFHMVLDLVILDQQQAVVDGVAEKDPGEGSGDDGRMPRALRTAGACSLEEPQPKLPATTIRSPGRSLAESHFIST